MKNARRSVLRRTCRWISVPVCLFVVTSIAGTAAAQVAESRDADDRIVIASEDTLSDAVMDTKRASGGATINMVTVASNQSISSTSTGNTVNVGGSLINGSITAGSGLGGSGFGSYVLNTGNNSTINSGVSLSILMMH